MAVGLNTRDKDLAAILRSILDRLRRVEQPQRVHIGPIGTSASAIPGYTLSVDNSGTLVATSDRGTVTVVATP